MKPVECIIQNGINYCQTQTNFPSLVGLLAVIIVLVIWVVYLILKKTKKEPAENITEDNTNLTLKEVYTMTNKGQDRYQLPLEITKNIRVYVDDKSVECVFSLELPTMPKPNKKIKVYYVGNPNEEI